MNLIRSSFQLSLFWCRPLRGIPQSPLFVVFILQNINITMFLGANI